jgi:hypothetical protein
MIPSRTSYLPVLLVVCFSALAPTAGAAGLQLALNAGARGGMLEIPCFEGFEFSWSADVEMRGEGMNLSSADAGAAVVGEGVLRFPGRPVELLFRGEAVEGADGVVLQAGIRNTGSEAVRLHLLTPLHARFRPRGDPRAWLISALDKTRPGSAGAGVGPAGVQSDDPGERMRRVVPPGRAGDARRAGRGCRRVCRTPDLRRGGRGGVAPR